MSNIAVRTVVRDILKVVKENNDGYFYLPSNQEDGEYVFSNLPFSFSVEVDLEFDESFDDPHIDGAFSHEDDTIEILIRLNPNNTSEKYYSLVGELNEVIAHELTHATQKYRGGEYVENNPENNIDYYIRPDEVEAQIKGFKRISKMTGTPYNEVVRRWFDTHQFQHGLNDDEIEKVISILT